MGIDQQNKRAKELEERVDNQTVAWKLDEDQVEDAMFYVERTKDGIADWKAAFDAQYVTIDESSLANWRNYMSAEVQEKGLDVASFVNILDAASSESAQRAEIPTGGVQQSMGSAQQSIRSLLGNER